MFVNGKTRGAYETCHWTPILHGSFISSDNQNHESNQTHSYKKIIGLLTNKEVASLFVFTWMKINK